MFHLQPILCPKRALALTILILAGRTQSQKPYDDFTCKNPGAYSIPGCGVGYLHCIQRSTGALGKEGPFWCAENELFVSSLLKCKEHKIPGLVFNKGCGPQYPPSLTYFRKVNGTHVGSFHYAPVGPRVKTLKNYNQDESTQQRIRKSPWTCLDLQTKVCPTSGYAEVCNCPRRYAVCRLVSSFPDVYGLKKVLWCPEGKVFIKSGFQTCGESPVGLMEPGDACYEVIKDPDPWAIEGCSCGG